MSKRQPSRSAVWLIPPTTLSASSTVAGTSRFVSMYAAVSPAGPAPITTIAVPADASAASSGPDLWVEFTRVDPCGAGAAVHPAAGAKA